ncbi:hypothetical protein AU196_06145 [Mycobacterium sp. IS-1742]|nr:hypothetical protein AU196_06145 [Mycobacterium sp. IS-1742]
MAWALAADMPERLASLTAMSVPHPAAFLRAMPTSRQAFASWYISFFQIPGIPERYLLSGDGSGSRMSRFMQSKAGQPKDAADRDARAMSEPGVLTAALNWYRAIPLSGIPRINRKITVPTMFVWSDRDAGLVEKGARLTGDHVSAEYRFKILSGSHWLLDEQSDAVADLLLEWLAAHPG